jgi:hypothetical protein
MLEYKKRNEVKFSLGHHQHPFDEFPAMRDWFRHVEAQNLSNPSDLLLYNLIKSFIAPSNEAVRHVTLGVDAFIRSSVNHKHDFIMADSLAVELGRSILEILTYVTENAVIANDGKRLLDPLAQLTVKTNLAAVRFLFAWILFNTGDIEGCIEECEKETEFTGPLNTLLGQALLESGKPGEAIGALELAVRLDAHDIIAYVQLVKAHLINNDPSKAISYLKVCKNLVGDHIEITCLSAMASIQDLGQNPQFADQALSELTDFLKDDPGNIHLFCLGIDLAATRNNSLAASLLIANIDMAKAAAQESFIKMLVATLKCLGEKSWHGAVAMLSSKAARFTGQLSAM